MARAVLCPVCRGKGQYYRKGVCHGCNGKGWIVKDEQPKVSKEARLLTIKEVSLLLGVHPNTVRHWSDAGLFPTYRFGQRQDRRFKREDIESFLDGKKVLLPEGEAEK
jgi:excisionase family DNA binding protein